MILSEAKDKMQFQRHKVAYEAEWLAFFGHTEAADELFDMLNGSVNGELAWCLACKHTTQHLNGVCTRCQGQGKPTTWAWCYDCIASTPHDVDGCLVCRRGNDD